MEKEVKLVKDEVTHGTWKVHKEVIRVKDTVAELKVGMVEILNEIKEVKKDK